MDEITCAYCQGEPTPGTDVCDECRVWFDIKWRELEEYVHGENKEHENETSLY